jgi:hypothetical protein
LGKRKDGVTNEAKLISMNVKRRVTQTWDAIPNATIDGKQQKRKLLVAWFGSTKPKI